MTARPSLKQTTGHPYTRMWGIGDYRPERVVTNDEICEHIDSSDEWIRERSGIITRHRAAPDESVVDMSVHASRIAIEQAGISPEQIGMVLLATVTHPWQTPAAAPMVADRIGAKNAAALDISAACAGYCYGIALADDIIRCGRSEFVLVIGVEKLSDFIDPTDRGAAFIFGDGAGAAVIGPSDFPGISASVWGADGSGYDLIAQDRGWPEAADAWKHPEKYDPETKGPWPSIGMKGPSVFRWAAFATPPICHEALDAAGVTMEDLDVFIPHQANIRIIEAMVKKLRLPEHVVVAKDIQDVANVSAASVPLATARVLRDGQAKSGDLALQIGFGAGLAYAAQVVVLP